MVGTVTCHYLAHRHFGAKPDARGISQWLSPAEQSEMHRFRSPERRLSWFSGRVLAKRVLRQAVAAGHLCQLPSNPAKISISSINQAGRSVRPQVHFNGESLSCALSISHTARGALVALSCDERIQIGVDLVERTQLDQRFMQLWFTPHERRSLELDKLLPQALRLWACKEAVYKAGNQGEKFVPQQIEIRSDPLGRRQGVRLTGDMRPGAELQDWQVDGQIAAMAIFNGPATSQQERKHHD